MQYPLTDFIKEEEEPEIIEDDIKEETDGTTGTESRTTLGRQPSVVSMDTSQDNQDTGTRRQSIAASNNSGMSRLVGKSTMWFPNRSDTNRPVQAQKRARSLKFRI